MKIAPLILLMVILALIIAPVSADVVMSFRDMNVLPSGYQSFHIYQVNGTGTYNLGLFNSTSDPINIADGSGGSAALILQFVPSTSDYINSPLLVVTNFIGYTSGHYPDLVVFFFLACLGAIAIALARKGV
jgi:hypothetical protein